MKKLLILILALSIFAQAEVAWASTPLVKLNDLPSEVGINEEFLVELSIDTFGEAVNGISLQLSISSNFDLVMINENGSIIPLWIERPKFESGVIKAAGIIPGGLSQVIIPGEEAVTEGKIFSFILRPKMAGAGKVVVKNQIITLHDGEGTEINNTNLSKSIKILPIERPLKISNDDKTQPEIFYPKLIRDESIFDGDLTLFFETRDFESGIDRYEVREDGGEFFTVTSPYRLRGQAKVGIITIRAIDRAGNDRTVELRTGFTKTSRVLWPVALALLVLLVVLLLVDRRKRSQ